MAAKEELIEYIRSLTPDEAKDALVIAFDWLSKRQEAGQHLPQKESLQSQSTE